MDLRSQEFLAAMKRAQEGEHPQFQAALQPSIDFMEQGGAAASQIIEKTQEDLEFFSMICKIVAEEDHPPAAAPAIAPAATASAATAVVENQAEPAVKEEPMQGEEPNVQQK